MEGLEIETRGLYVDKFEGSDVFNSSINYPLSMDKKLAQGDTFRLSKEKLAAKLNEISVYYETETLGPPHSKAAECPRCTERKSKIAHVFAEYYLSIEPWTWSMEFTALRQELRARLDDPNSSLEDAHELFQAGLREHLRRDLCAPEQLDDPTSHRRSLKASIVTMFKDEPSLATILEFYIKEMDARAPTREAAHLLMAMQGTKTAEERAKLYVEYYCTENAEDTPVSRKFKQKYARIFESLVPHDEVIAAMRNESDSYVRDRDEKFQNRIGELQMARNAHLKNQQKKQERTMREQEKAREQMAECFLERCMREVNLETDEVTECGICQWLATKGGVDGERRDRAVYCSAEHAEEDFEQHDQHSHACIMSDRCVSYPSTGPSDTTSAGICNNCAANGYISYFCSAECHNHNYELHRDDFMLRDIGIHNDDDALVIFEVAKEGELLVFDSEEDGEIGGGDGGRGDGIGRADEGVSEERGRGRQRESDRERRERERYEDEEEGEELEEGERMDDS